MDTRMGFPCPLPTVVIDSISLSNYLFILKLELSLSKISVILNFHQKTKKKRLGSVNNYLKRLCMKDGVFQKT